MPFFVEHGFYALCESDHIAVITLQDDLITIMDHLDHIDGTDGSGLRTHAVKEIDDFLLVGNGDVESL